MARYTQSSIERLRDAVDMIDLVGTRTELRRVGSRWVGLCPFHDERTPSFSVEADRGLYHCFGCGVGGDAIAFVRETEALDFAEAVELLAERYHVELERESESAEEQERRRRRGRLLALLERTTAFYERFLWDSKEAARARDYLAGRGFAEQTLRTFRVGWAPGGWDRLLTGAQRDGFTLAELLAAGLAQRRRSGEGGVDRFRERIVFPLADARGRVLGFGARTLNADEPAKYINTAENEIFHKGRQLFGIDKARAAAAKAGRVVAVEGYTDALALHQAGVPETVAIMGTALTEHQLAELARAAGGDGVVYLALDADSSGQQAMLRAAKIAEDRDVELRVVALPEGRDPAELVGDEGREGIVGRLDGALSVVEFAVRRTLAEGALGTPEGRDRTLAQAGALIAETPARSARRDHLVRLVADRLDLPDDYVVAAVADAPARAPAPARGQRSAPDGGRDPGPDEWGDPGPEREWADAPASPAAGGGAPAGPVATALEAERIFLANCLAAGPAGRDYLERLTADHLSSEILRRVHAHLVANFDDPLAELDPDDHELGALVAGIALAAEDRDQRGLAEIKMGFLMLEQRRIDRLIRRVRSEGGSEAAARLGELAAARQQVRRDMDAVMGEVT